MLRGVELDGAEGSVAEEEEPCWPIRRPRDGREDAESVDKRGSSPFWDGRTCGEDFSDLCVKLLLVAVGAFS